jgi:transcriptional regulator with XRE-family HTH domain
MSVGEAIKAIRERTGLSQEKFAQMLNVSMMSVSRWERNAVTPGADYLSAIAGVGRDFEESRAAAVLERHCGFQLRANGSGMLRTAVELVQLIQTTLARAAGSGDDPAADIQTAIDAAIAAERICRDLLAMLPLAHQEEAAL